MKKQRVILFKPSLSFGCDGTLIKNQFIKFFKKNFDKFGSMNNFVHINNKCAILVKVDSTGNTSEKAF